MALEATTWVLVGPNYYGYHRNNSRCANLKMEDFGGRGIKWSRPRSVPGPVMDDRDVSSEGRDSETFAEELDDWSIGIVQWNNTRRARVAPGRLRGS